MVSPPSKGLRWNREKTEEERLPGSDPSLFADERGKRAVKCGRIPEERVGKKRAPGTGRGEGTSANAAREVRGERRA